MVAALFSMWCHPRCSMSVGLGFVEHVVVCLLLLVFAGRASLQH